MPGLSLTAASAALREDGLPLHDVVTVVHASGGDVLIPLTRNPIRAAAGLTARLDFDGVHSSGPLALGFVLASLADPSLAEPDTLLGETFQVAVPGLPAPVPARSGRAGPRHRGRRGRRPSCCSPPAGSWPSRAQEPRGPWPSPDARSRAGWPRCARAICSRPPATWTWRSIRPSRSAPVRGSTT